ncbi:MAG: hypothetical protein U5L45_21015 [Saprospiraceae bacterium]|nr:hypothetical protein [Saprospiraceae bacterium]
MQQRMEQAQQQMEQAQQRMEQAQQQRDKDFERSQLQSDKTQLKIDDLSVQQAITDRQIRQTNKQLGEMNNKWGTFTEGMAGASIEKILFDKFGISNVGFRIKSKINGEALELDGFGYANGSKNVAVVVEVKSHLRDDSIEQIENTLENFPKFFPEHADKKLYSLIVCVHAPTSFEKPFEKKGDSFGSYAR